MPISHEGEAGRVKATRTPGKFQEVKPKGEYKMEQIRTTNDLLRAVQAEIHAAKTGKLSEPLARVVFRGRALQIKMAEINLRYLSLVLRRGLQPKGEMLLLADGKNSKGKAKA